MIRRPAAVLFGLSVAGSALPLLAADAPEVKGPEKSFEVTNTERANFPPGGTIRLEKSYGYLTVEGWDKPEVEAVITKSTDRFYEPGQQEEEKQRMESIRVVTERLSETELSIKTVLPPRSGRLAPLLPRTTKAGVTLEYKVHVPRDSRLIVHHDYGYIWVSDVTGDIEVHSHTGDMIVMLPDPGSYSIDAITRMGSISSDLVGKGIKQYLVGTHFAYASQAPSRRIYLRMGRGSITIKNGPPSGAFWNN
jgi:hypothetical protein